MVTMSAGTPASALGDQVRAMWGSLRRSWDEGGRLERMAYLVAAGLFASGLVHLAILVVSGGSWSGPLSLRKPTTFGLSFGLTLATVVWATSFLGLGRGKQTVFYKARWRSASVLGAFTVTSFVEVALVSLQAWRGVPSHFNFETPLDRLITGTLALGGLVIVLTVAAWTIAAFRAVADSAPSMRLALRFGFAALLVALGVGAAMIATGAATVRTDPQLAYTTAGFLKPAHAVPMHAILIVPGLAWLLTFTRFTEPQRLRIVQLAVTGYLLLGVVVLIESIARVSPLAAPVLATLASGLGLAALIAAGAIALYDLIRDSIRPAIPSRES